ncbi:type IV pilus biogenesis protein PilM [Legionella fairfieldensis]|uniref:type IV pilus biogenesis protein PilM n=1 Tax=Legionella fairfieldensis TaxID=45064 RepID=UPI0004907BE8|nr:type IV pilus assembly protein PilM [Legionella fairfieldensis]
MMFLQFRSRRCAMLGIDMNPTSVNVVEISRQTTDQFRVENYGQRSLPLGLIEAGAIKNTDILASCIENLLTQINSSCHRVALALPDSIVISKTVQFIKGLSNGELEELVRYEAEKYLACSLDEIAIDFTVLGSSSKKAGMLDVLFVASRRENISKRIESLRYNNLNVEIVDIKSYAIARIISRLINRDKDKSNIIAAINISGCSINVLVFSNGKLVYTKEELFECRLAPREGLAFPQEHSHIMSQIKRMIQYFLSTNNYDLIECFFLSGELEFIVNISCLIQEEMKTKTVIVDPFQYMDIAPHINLKLLKKIAPSFLISCGLALR